MSGAGIKHFGIFFFVYIVKYFTVFKKYTGVFLVTNVLNKNLRVVGLRQFTYINLTLYTVMKVYNC